MLVPENSSLDLICTPELASLFFGHLLHQWFLPCKKEMMLLDQCILEQMLLDLDCSFGRLPVASRFCSKLSSSQSGLKVMYKYDATFEMKEIEVRERLSDQRNLFQ
jgi:hypothetical protein